MNYHETSQPPVSQRTIEQIERIADIIFMRVYSIPGIESDVPADIEDFRLVLVTNNEPTNNFYPRTTLWTGVAGNRVEISDFRNEPTSNRNKGIALTYVREDGCCTLNPDLGKITGGLGKRPSGERENTTVERDANDPEARIIAAEILWELRNYIHRARADRDNKLVHATSDTANNELRAYENQTDLEPRVTSKDYERRMLEAFILRAQQGPPISQVEADLFNSLLTRI